eukprot:998155-Rhodomonas_salina.3
MRSSTNGHVCTVVKCMNQSENLIQNEGPAKVQENSTSQYQTMKSGPEKVQGNSKFQYRALHSGGKMIMCVSVPDIV